MSSDSDQGPPGLARRSPLLVDELIGQLLWPRFLRAYRLAAAPGRVLMCTGFILAVAIANWLLAKASGVPGGPLALLGDTIGRELAIMPQSLRPREGAGGLSALEGPLGLYQLFVAQPLAVLKSHWWALVLVAPVALAGLAITAGAVSRSVACEVCLGATLPWRRASSYAWSRWLSLTACVLGPILAFWLLAAIVAGAGRLLFAWQLTGLVGSAVYPAFILACFALTVLALGLLLGGLMLVPAMAVEGADAFDAVQRTYAYVIARPGRLLLYLALIALLTALAVWGATLLIATTLMLARFLTGADPADPAVWRASRALLNVWTVLPIIVGAGYVLSLLITHGTLLYLVMRRIVDGQDFAELWVPGDASPAPAKPEPVVPGTPSQAGGADYT
jgi:hypothetical protein